MSNATVAALLALAASVGYGASDVLSGIVVRNHTVAATALWAQTTGLTVLGVVVLLRLPHVSLGGVSWGLAAGVVAALAVLAFYSALQGDRTAVVAPIAGCGVLIPVVVGLVTGDPVRAPSLAGIAAMIVGVLVVAAASGGERAPSDAPISPTSAPPLRGQRVAIHDGCRPRSAPRVAPSPVTLSVLSAICFGSFYVLLAHATSTTAIGSDVLDDVLVIALAVQAGALVVTVAAVTRHTRRCLRPDRSLVLLAVGVGLLDVTSDVLLTGAASVGPLALVGPLGSLAPVVTIVLATGLLRERLSRWQAVGVGVAAVGIGLASWG